MDILLAVDGSAYTKKMLKYLGAHKQLFATANSYTLFTAQPALMPRVSSSLSQQVAQSYYADETEKVLKPAHKQLMRHGIDAKCVWKVGPVGETIAKFADSGKFDLLIMGSHGHGALATLVMGSVATRVLASCKVPLLLVR